jgi:alpha-1,6-mannosyltransferase
MRSRYRALLNLRAVEEIIERERPDLIESSDPYQLGWESIKCGRLFGIPVVGFYHSHFAEAYLLPVVERFGQIAAEAAMNIAGRYVRNLYNQFQRTLVPSERLAQLLHDWGVRNLETVRLGVNTEIFNARSDDSRFTREALGMEPSRKLLLYVGRLAPEKNTRTLFDALELLHRRWPNDFHSLIIGDGPERDRLRRLQSRIKTVSWIQYCADPGELARYYRAADIFVHPGMREVFGLSALESQACGTSVVGVRNSNLPVFHEQDAWASENTPEALADAIEWWSTKPLAMIGAAASQIVAERYAWPQVFDELFGVYREVCRTFRKRAV